MSEERTDWTRAEVREQEAKANELRARAREAKDRKEDLNRRIAEGMADGEEVAGLQAERAEVERLRQDLEAALPVLADRIDERRELALRAEAASRLIAISRAHGSVRTNYHGDVGRVKKTAGAFVEAVWKALSRYDGLQRLEVEALALCDRFEDLDRPDLPRVVQPASDERIVAALGRARSVSVPRRENLPARLVAADERAARRLLSGIKGTPTAEILEAAGPRGEDHETRHRRAMEESRDRHDEGAKAAIERAVEWLRAELSEGPVPLDELVQRAEEAGFVFRRDRNRPGQSITDAAEVVGVVGLEEERNGPVWWCAGAYDHQRFRPLQMSRSVGSMRW